MTKSLNRYLQQLAEAKTRFGKIEAGITENLLRLLKRRHFSEAEPLIQYHELLLFLRAYPANARILQLAEGELTTFAQRVERLAKQGADMTPFADPEVSGIAGTSVTDVFSYYVVRGLVERYPQRTEIYWGWFESENRLAETWPRFFPLLGEDAYVEANVPYPLWLKQAPGKRESQLVWLLERFANLPKPEDEKAELYDSQQIYVTWALPRRSSRTDMRLPVRQIFYHRSPLLQRRDVSLKETIAAPPAKLKHLSPAQGERVLHLAQDSSTARYRELYGFTHGDPRDVKRVHVGRGVDLFLVALPPARRLPLRAYHAALIFKNGIMVGYFEGLSLFERMESGFNFYYTFREGETAWIYAQTLNVFHHLLGVTSFALDPYQVGHENEEGIASGAFWFYRKLGFRPTDPQIMELTRREEAKLQARKDYRVSPTILRRLAAGSMIFETEEQRRGDWDKFQVRKLGLALNRLMAQRFAGKVERLRATAFKDLMQVVSSEKISARDAAMWRDFAMVLQMVPDLQHWSAQEKRELVRIVKLKASGEEAQYLRAMQKHERLRREIIRLGSEERG